jgi:tRNA 2-thiouridine synthesizing protein D
MRFALAVHGAPALHPCARTALHFARAALDAGHGIHRVFFQGAGVHNASALVVPPQDELDVPAAWAELGRAHDLDLVVCVASALRHGLLDGAEATRYERGCGNVRPEFDLSGLGQLVDATLQADRVITFGP